MKNLKYRYLLNFSASYQGGGLKRLTAFAGWFHEHGGATFIIHSNSAALSRQYPNNDYHIVKPNKIKRLFSDGYYLKNLFHGNMKFDLYFSYGIPIYSKIAKVNWFHLSNLLPLGHSGISLGWKLKLMMILLGKRLKKNKDNCDIISGESEYSMGFYQRFRSSKSDIHYLVSNNGVDRKLLEFSERSSQILNQVTVVGTQSYKQIQRSYAIFKSLQLKCPGMVLNIVGEKTKLARHLANDGAVRLLGNIEQAEVYLHLSTSAYFISNSLIENSSNASLEGVLLAENSILSDIPPNRELLAGCPYQEIVENGEKMLLVDRSYAKHNLRFKTWDAIVKELIRETNTCLSDSSRNQKETF